MIESVSVIRLKTFFVQVKDLCLIFYEQLKDDQLTKEIADQVKWSNSAWKIIIF